MPINVIFVYLLALGLCGMFLPCCQICQTANRAGESGCLYVLLSFITPCVPILLLRSKVRDQHGIPGSTLGDVCAACLCPCCASIQLANEVEERIWDGMGWLKFRARNTNNRIFSIPGRLPLIKMLKDISFIQFVSLINMYIWSIKYLWNT